MEAEAKVLVDEQVWPELKRLAARKRRGRATVAVPYVTEPLLDLRAGDTLAVDLSPPILRAGQTNPKVLRHYLRAGVRLYSSPGLHAKIFVLGDTAVVGSSNMSKASERVLREAVIVVKDRAAVRAAAEAARRLLDRELGKGDLDDAARLYRPPQRGPARPTRPSTKYPAGPPPTVSDRLWVLGLYLTDWPATAEKRAAAANRGIRRRAGAAADVEIGSALFDLDVAPKLRLDDVVIEASAPAKTKPLEEAFHPARVIELLEVPGRGRSSGWLIAYWRRPTGTTPRPWADVQKAAAKAGARLSADSTFTRRISDPTLHAALCRLWRAPR
jgi:hypothetical protein